MRSYDRDMITNATELNVAVHQLSSFADMLEALRLDAESKREWDTFSHLSKGYFIKIHQLNAEIREYLNEHEGAMTEGRTDRDAVINA